MRSILECIGSLLHKPQPSLLALSIGQFTGSNLLARHRDLIAALSPPPPMFPPRPQIRVVCTESGIAHALPTRQTIAEHAQRTGHHLALDSRQAKAA